MKKTLLNLLMLIIVSTTLSAQTLWEENFESYTVSTGISGIDGTPIGDYPDNVTNWSIDASNTDMNDSANDYFYVNNGRFYGRDLDGKAKIIFTEVDITAETGDVTIIVDDVDFNIIGTTSTFGSNPSDVYTDIEYSLDGGATYTLFTNHMGNGDASHTFIVQSTVMAGEDTLFSFSETIDPGSATTVKLRITMANTGPNERSEIDDISIVRNSVTLFTEDFSNYTNKSGLVGTGSHLFKETGDYASVTKWSLTPISNSQLINSFDHARTTLTSSSNGTKVLIFNDVNNNVTFDTETIDITGKSQITFGMDLIFKNTTYESTDHLDVYYSTDNGANYTLVQDNGAGHTFSGGSITAGTVNFSETLSGLNATDLKIRIVGDSNSNTEDFEIDNIKVVIGSTLNLSSNKLIGVKMYPNPVTNNVLYINSQFNGNSNLELYDISGRKVLSTTTSSNKLNLSNIKRGVYIVKLTQDGKSIVQRIILQ